MRLGSHCMSTVEQYQKYIFFTVTINLNIYDILDRELGSKRKKMRKKKKTIMISIW